MDCSPTAKFSPLLFAGICAGLLLIALLATYASATPPLFSRFRPRVTRLNGTILKN